MNNRPYVSIRRKNTQLINETHNNISHNKTDNTIAPYNHYNAVESHNINNHEPFNEDTLIFSDDSQVFNKDYDIFNEGSNINQIVTIIQSDLTKYCFMRLGKCYIYFSHVNCHLPLDCKLICEISNNKYNEGISITEAKQILEYIKANCQNISDEKIYYDNIKNLINFKSFCINIQSRENLYNPMLSQKCFFNYIAVEYCPALGQPSCENSNLFLQLITNNNQEKINLIQEVVGYIISNNADIPTIFFITGNEKVLNVIKNLFSSIISPPFQTSIETTKIESEMKKGNLTSTILNIYDYQPKDPQIKPSKLNRLRNLKNFNIKEDAYFFPLVKYVYFGYRLPSFSVNEINKNFLDGIVHIDIPDISDEQINSFSNGVLTEEASEIIEWALQGLYRLIENNLIFTDYKSIEKQKIENSITTECKTTECDNKKQDIHIDIITNFINEMIFIDESIDLKSSKPRDLYRIERNNVIKVYLDYCANQKKKNNPAFNNYNPINDPNMFSRKMQVIASKMNITYKKGSFTIDNGKRNTCMLINNARFIGDKYQELNILPANAQC